MNTKDDDTVVSLTVNVRSRDLKYYAALNMILYGSDDDWEFVDDETVDSIITLLETLIDSLLEDELERLKGKLQRVSSLAEHVLAGIREKRQND